MAIHYIINIDSLYTDTIYYIRDMLTQVGVEYDLRDNDYDTMMVNIGGVELSLRQDLYASGNDVVIISDTEICLMRKTYIDDLKRSIKCKEFDSFVTLFRWLKLKQLLQK